MDMNETMLELDGLQYLRVPVAARLRGADLEEVPDNIRGHVRATAGTKPMYWQDTENPDIVWVNFILDSEGVNKNNDYMPRSQLLTSYHTAAHKPMDMEHVIKEQRSLVGLNRENPAVKNTIFGVMTHAALANYEGKLLTPKQIEKIERTDDMERPEKDRVTVVAWAALYYFLFPETVKDLVKRIKSGDMFVSMERWLKKWDFLVAKADDPDDYETVTKEEAEKNGTFERWKLRQRINGADVIRRTIAYSYGGVATTANPANELSRFIEQTKESRVKAAAALAENSMMKQLLAQHDQVVDSYVNASGDEREALKVEHTRIHRAIAAYIG